MNAPPENYGCRVEIAYKAPNEGWRSRMFKTERDAWAFIAELDADVEVRWLEDPTGYTHTAHLLGGTT